VGAGSGAFATMVAVVMVLLPLRSAWAGSRANSAASSSAVANSLSSDMATPQNVTEINPDGNQLADDFSRMNSLEASQLPRVGSRSEYLRGASAEREDMDLQLLGIEAEDGSDRFEGQDVYGAEILKVRPSSPGALAGLQSRRAAINTVLRVVTLAGTLAFPPVGIACVVVLETGVGDWHDLIIGVDGERVEDVSDLETALEQAKAGDVVYLTVLREDKRLQVPVTLAGVGIK
jgi:hypothetical protein